MSTTRFPKRFTAVLLALLSLAGTTGCSSYLICSTRPDSATDGKSGEPLSFDDQEPGIFIAVYREIVVARAAHASESARLVRRLDSTVGCAIEKGFPGECPRRRQTLVQSEEASFACLPISSQERGRLLAQGYLLPYPGIEGSCPSCAPSPTPPTSIPSKPQDGDNSQGSVDIKINLDAKRSDSEKSRRETTTIVYYPVNIASGATAVPISESGSPIQVINSGVNRLPAQIQLVPSGELKLTWKDPTSGKPAGDAVPIQAPPVEAIPPVPTVSISEPKKLLQIDSFETKLDSDGNPTQLQINFRGNLGKVAEVKVYAFFGEVKNNGSCRLLSFSVDKDSSAPPEACQLKKDSSGFRDPSKCRHVPMIRTASNILLGPFSSKGLLPTVFYITGLELWKPQSSPDDKNRPKIDSFKLINLDLQCPKTTPSSK